jgi:hypothetical protein
MSNMIAWMPAEGRTAGDGDKRWVSAADKG